MNPSYMTLESLVQEQNALCKHLAYLGNALGDAAAGSTYDTLANETIPVLERYAALDFELQRRYQAGQVPEEALEAVLELLMADMAGQALFA